MRKLLALSLLIILTALLLPQTGRAQDEIHLGLLRVDLWPEFDRPEMLVIYNLTLAPDVIPAALTFRIPKEVGLPYKVAVWAEDGNLYEIEYAFQAGSEWGEVTFQVDNPNFQLEYYDPRLVQQGPNRTFTYTWPGDYAIITASIVVQQPADASQMEFTPGENVTSFTGVVDDLTYYTLPLGTLAKDQVFDFSLSYQKSSPILTREKQQVHPAGDLPRSIWSRGLPWAIGVLAMLVIAAGVLIYWRAGQPEAGEKKRKRRKAAAQASGEAAVDDSGVYCHRCGRRGALNDVFCRSCGTKLRI
jgi:hypothetical protein